MAHIPPCAWGALLCSWFLPVFKLDTASCSNTDGKVYRYNSENGLAYFEKGTTLRNILVQLPKGAQQLKMYQYSVSLSMKTLAITTVFQYMRKTSAFWCHFLLNFFFVLRLFVPLNTMQQLKDTCDTRYQFILPACCALRAQFLRGAALPAWQFCVGTLALTTGSLRSKIGGN